MDELNLAYNQIRVVKGLKNLRYLHNLDLLGNPIESIESIEELEGITRVKINLSKIFGYEREIFFKHFRGQRQHHYLSRKYVDPNAGVSCKSVKKPE